MDNPYVGKRTPLDPTFTPTFTDLHHPLAAETALRGVEFLRMETWDPDSWPKRKEGRDFSGENFGRFDSPTRRTKTSCFCGLCRENHGEKTGGIFFFEIFLFLGVTFEGRNFVIL